MTVTAGGAAEPSESTEPSEAPSSAPPASASASATVAAPDDNPTAEPEGEGESAEEEVPGVTGNETLEKIEAERAAQAGAVSGFKFFTFVCIAFLFILGAAVLFFDPTSPRRAVTYTGDVAVGGPADVRELPGLRVTKLAVGPYDNNVYLLRCAASGATLLVDGANEAPRILDALGGDALDSVVQTHGHFDHIQALAEIATATGARVLCHEGDAGMMPDGVGPSFVADGDTVRVGEVALRAIHLWGHTPGGLALLYEGDPERPHLFTGDSLFPGGPGNTEKDPERFTRLMDDLEAKVFGPLPDETWVYPGHGKDTTLGAERPSLPEWRARGW